MILTKHTAESRSYLTRSSFMLRLGAFPKKVPSRRRCLPEEKDLLHEGLHEGFSGNGPREDLRTDSSQLGSSQLHVSGATVGPDRGSRSARGAASAESPSQAQSPKASLPSPIRPKTSSGCSQTGPPNPGRSLDALKTAYKRSFEQLSPEEVLQEAGFTARWRCFTYTLSPSSVKSIGPFIPAVFQRCCPPTIVRLFSSAVLAGVSVTRGMASFRCSTQRSRPRSHRNGAPALRHAALVF
ncbi:hypothetical protein GGP45_003058 [Salinibacter ruber]|uniref:Uncharacterized protein n=1 Tax=Salinibacter ruber TaxID=146919 RepID=A0A9X2V7B4_9BACT|nr:hypothetical protein [Salinibacter ruber]